MRRHSSPGGVALLACSLVMLAVAPVAAWKALDGEEPHAVFLSSARALLEAPAAAPAAPEQFNWHHAFGNVALALAGLSGSLFTGAAAWFAVFRTL